MTQTPRYILLLLFACLTTLTYGQHRRNVSSAGQHQTAQAPTTDDIKTLIDNYKFGQAAHIAQQRLAQARKAHQPAGMLQADAARALAGINMLSATQRVTFIDSFVVDKGSVLEHIHTDPSCGQLAYWKDVFRQMGQTEGDVATSTTYTNDFKDKLYYANAAGDGHQHLFVRYKEGDHWSAPAALDGLGDSTDGDTNPYVLADGVTLYFASNRAGGLGGYDLYVTRYSTDDNSYLKPENMGMPFSSPANDYLLAIDEVNQLGWLVTDRRQPEGKACIYLFVPEESRTVYEQTAVNADSIRLKAMIHDIKSTQTDAKYVAAARQRYQQLLKSGLAKQQKADDLHFVVYNGIIYHGLSDFKSSKAKQLASNWKDLRHKRDNLLTELRQNRAKVDNQPSLKATILKQEQAVEQLDDAIQDLEWNIRYEEQSRIGANK